MSESDKDLTVAIKLATDDAGGRQAVETIKDAGKATEAATEATKAHSKATGDGSEKMRIFGESTGEAKRAVLELREQFPIAAEDSSPSP